MYSGTSVEEWIPTPFAAYSRGLSLCRSWLYSARICWSHSLKGILSPIFSCFLSVEIFGRIDDFVKNLPYLCSRELWCCSPPRLRGERWKGNQVQILNRPAAVSSAYVPDKYLLCHWSAYPLAKDFGKPEIIFFGKSFPWQSGIVFFGKNLLPPKTGSCFTTIFPLYICAREASLREGVRVTGASQKTCHNS